MGVAKYTEEKKILDALDLYETWLFKNMDVKTGENLVRIYNNYNVKGTRIARVKVEGNKSQLFIRIL